jgi:hypothetical protein
MNPLRVPGVILAALLASTPAWVCAQAMPADSANPADASKPGAAPGKSTARKDAARKDDGKGNAVKKVAKKDAAPKAAASKAAPASTAPKQATKTYSTGPTTLRDRDGNVIPNNPEAYNVDSARK